jgi:hypothetical protein
MNIEISSPVPKSMKNEVMKSFNHKSVFVSVESSGKVIKAYRVTENDKLKIGSFMMLQDDEEPYVVRIPGYNGRISLFFSDDVRVWRDKTIFNYRPIDIQTIDIDYESNPQASFTYNFLGPGNIQISSKSLNSSIKVSTEVAKSYLTGFASVSFLKQVAPRSKAIFDSLKKQQPFCEIQVKNVVNKINVVKTYRIPVHGKQGEFDPNWMYAVIQNDTVPVIIKYVDFDPIMKEYSDFVKK